MAFRSQKKRRKKEAVALRINQPNLLWLVGHGYRYDLICGIDRAWRMFEERGCLEPTYYEITCYMGEPIRGSEVKILSLSLAPMLGRELIFDLLPKLF